MCVYACLCLQGGRSVASQIEIDGQDYGEKDDGSEDEDQDTILDDPGWKERERETEKRRGSGRVHRSHVVSAEKSLNSHMFTCTLNEQASTEAYHF